MFSSEVEQAKNYLVLRLSISSSESEILQKSQISVLFVTNFLVLRLTKVRASVEIVELQRILRTLSFYPFY